MVHPDGRHAVPPPPAASSSTPAAMMTDEELDREWKPNGKRPQSTIARSFSQELMDIFRIENSVADLDANVEQRRKEVSTQTSELQAIEARIRETEERLRRQQRSIGGNLPFTPEAAAAAAAAGAAPTAGRPAGGSTAALHRRPPPADKDAPPVPLDKDLPLRLSRQPRQPGNGQGPRSAAADNQQPGGAMPPTPVASEDGDQDHAS